MLTSIPGFLMPQAEEAPVRRIVVDINWYDIGSMSVLHDDYLRWCICERLRKAGIPITPLYGELRSGVLTWFDLHDAPVRRFIWEGQV